MSFLTALNTLLLKPLQLIFEVVYSFAYRNIHDPGLAIIALSLAINFLVLPLYQRADAMQEEERQAEARLQRWVNHIKKTFHGDERTMMLQTYYRQNNYSPTYVLRGAVSLFLEIPFFIAAYRFLSGLELLEGVSFGPIADLSKPDGLLVIGGLAINLLPILMTLTNVVSSAIFTKGYPLKTKIQLYGMAGFFLVFLYSSPSGLVFYWTLNNLFSLVKTIFYKIKHPRFVLSILAALTGCGVLFWGSRVYLGGGRRKAVLILLAGVLLFLPLMGFVMKKRLPAVAAQEEQKVGKKTFFLGGMVLAVLTGMLIPSTIINASPQEFVDRSAFVHPLWFIAYAFLLAAGIFVFWFGVFFWLASPKGKRIFELAVWCLAGVAIVDYLAFSRDLGLLTAELLYEKPVFFSAQDVAINLAVIFLAALVFAWVFMKRRKLVSQVLTVLLITFLCMTGVNCWGIRDSIGEVDLGSGSDGVAPNITLSKDGENVIVIMMDRGIGEYIPYIFAEKPELKEQYAGFTYYSNVASFGASTNFGSPAFYGGYEYTPIEMNTRASEPLAEKHNEALKVMPVLFDDNGFDVTVFDPTYAGYSWTPKLSIFDEYKDIQKFITMGYFYDSEVAKTGTETRSRNFFCHSIMKIAPLYLQYYVYNNGQYNNSAMLGEGNKAPSVASGQTCANSGVATGLRSTFMESYYVLQNMKNMTKVSEKEPGTFLMMSNDLTHEIMLLSEPDYTPKMHVDNRQYDVKHRDRFVIDGKALVMNTAVQYSHYQCNMAALMLLGDWLDYLKECGVYDNTRIIVASDHGRNLHHLPEMEYDVGAGELVDLESYCPLLMVKDFGSTTFTTSDEFKTNADVPPLATAQVIANPVNPFTGKHIDSAEKTAHDQYICGSTLWSTAKNNGNTFQSSRWFTVHDSVWDPNNWSLVAEDAVLTRDDMK